MRIVSTLLFSLFTFLGSLGGVAFAQQAPAEQARAEQQAPHDQAVFAFTGRYVNAYIENSLTPFFANYEDNFVLGGGYQQFVLEPLPDLKLGAEVGMALRGGTATSGEIWVGPVIRYDGFRLGENLRISPSLTVGFSAVTGPIGVEAERAQRRNGDPTLLFFMAPEIAVSTVDNPQTELFYRVQHRSGAWGTLGGMADGANAQVLGIRFKF